MWYLPWTFYPIISIKGTFADTRSDVCQKCFGELNNLYLHKLTHSTYKPYKCDVCQKCFSTCSSFNSHKLIHTGMKPYKCDVCQKCFSRAGVLKRHKLTHKDVTVWYVEIFNCFTMSKVPVSFLGSLHLLEIPTLYILLWYLVTH